MMVTRRAEISGKVFDLDMLHRLANVVFERHRQLEDSDFEIKVGFADKSEYVLEAPGSLNLAGPIGVKRPQFFNLMLSNLRPRVYLTVSLAHGRREGSLLVQGADENWMNETFFRLQELVQSAPSHADWLYRCRGVVNQMIYLAAGWLWIAIWGPIFDALRVAEKDINFTGWLAFLQANNTLLKMFSPFIYWLVGCGVLSMPLRVYFWQRFWPNVDLNFGPEHEKTEKRVRHAIFAIISLIVIPSLLAIIFDLLKTVN